MTAAARVASVDALRGLTVAAMLLVNNPGDWGHVYAPLLHATWHGCTPTDLVFPFFLFVVGVSIALGKPGPRDIAWRALRIIALGLALHAAAMWLMERPNYRVFGVLQRIGLCFGAAALIACYGKPRAQWAWIAGILLGYWAALWVGGSYEKGADLATRVDTAMLGRFAYEFDRATGVAFDPEGLVSTPAAIATTLLGVRFGAWLRAGNLQAMVLFTALSLALGLAWSLALPLNKALWTSSYALWTAGLAALALLAMHLAIDRRGWPAIGRAMGINAIAVYVGAALMAYVLIGMKWKAPIYEVGFGWVVPLAGPYSASLAFALAFTAVWWIVAKGMEKWGVRISI